MTQPVIQVRDLSKCYQIRSATPKSYHSLREDLVDGFKSLLRGEWEQPQSENFWALKDINFDVHQGEVVGIIGRNGAGKSTLLKILSQIVRPTSGEVTIRGRVGSLLEVGTGFHPELTGRENIFMNGAILGMKRAEIVRKFDEIVSFAEVEKFLDTPVKHYSSGMYVRLAFAVAAHLEPEILIVDEVLAVGDAQFQKKCLGKINEVSQKEGKTVLFVSHQMSMISSLCQKAILLKQGEITKRGLSSEVILSYYYDDDSSPAHINYSNARQRVGDEYAELLECYIKNRRGEIITEANFDDEIVIGMRYNIMLNREFDRVYPYPNCNIFSGDGTHIFYTTVPNRQLFSPSVGEYLAEFSIPSNFLNSGTYFVGLALSTCDHGVKVHFYEQNALCFQIKENIDNTLYDDRNGWSGVLPGVVHPKLSWTLQPLTSTGFGLEHKKLIQVYKWKEYKMAETLGALCDKLTIVKLKQWHSEDPERLNSLAIQERQLQLEINQFVEDAITGKIPTERLVFSANKVFKKDGNYVPDVIGNIGEVFSQLAEVNCKLWHEQEKVYEFEKVPPPEKDLVVKQLALLNLERNKCIDRIDRQFQTTISQSDR